ncbi:ChaN family lipoprotein [soil metagenome]
MNMQTLRRFGLVLALAACAQRGEPPAAAHPPPHVDAWTTHVDEANPLVGKSFSARGTPIDRASVDALVNGHRFVLLGEKHDNPDHHRLQAQALAAIVSAGRRPAVAFEQIDLDLQPAVDAYLARNDATFDGLAVVLAWDTRGFPPFAMYRPIFEVVLRSHLAVIATGLGRDMIRAVMKEGSSALPAALAARLHLDHALAPELAASLDAEIEASHCGALPSSMIAPMSLTQRVKDAVMADAMLAHDGPNGVVLIAGNGHVRTDRGVPERLRAARSDLATFSVSFVEVDASGIDPAAYAKAEPADVLVFTPRVDDEDPCAAFTHGK